MRCEMGLATLGIDKLSDCKARFAAPLVSTRPLHGAGGASLSRPPPQPQAGPATKSTHSFSVIPFLHSSCRMYSCHIVFLIGP
jgi:hypothetical protein